MPGRARRSGHPDAGQGPAVRTATLQRGMIVASRPRRVLYSALAPDLRSKDVSSASPIENLPVESVRDLYVLDHQKLRTEAYELVHATEKVGGRPCAIQRLLPSIASNAECVEQFVIQALAAARSHCKNILAVHGVARDDEGPYAVVEWPENGILESRLSLGPLPSTEVEKLAEGLANALATAFDRGFCHGRVVPSEVLLSSGDTPWLGAFGIGLPDDESSTLLIDDDKKPARPVHRHSPNAADDAHRLCLLLDRAIRGRPGAHNKVDPPPWLTKLLHKGLASDSRARFRNSNDIADWLRAERGQGAAGERSDDAPTAGAITSSPEAPGSRSSRGSSSNPRTQTAGSATSAEDAGGRAEFPWRPLHEQYRIEGEALAGGMGTVIRAIEMATGRAVAVKRMKNADAAAVRRFRREAAAIARLNHPNVLQLMQAARDDDGDYLVLEWAPNGSLADVLKRDGKLPFESVLDVARKIGSALSYAHGKGCIHRDVKPHNILLSESNEPKLADFGLARAIEENSLTTSTAGGGSPVYMPPEQWQDSHKADARSDVYAFAKTLYHLMTGEKPATIDKQRLTPQLVTVFKKATEQDADDRYASIQEFLVAFGSACGAERTEARSSSTAPAGSRSGTFILVGIALLLVLGGAGYALRDQPFMKPIRDRVVGKNESDSVGAVPQSGEKSKPEESQGRRKRPLSDFMDRRLQDLSDVNAALEVLPAYHGLVLAPQKGLTPLRIDPVSQLVEFVHDASGVAPEFLGGGRYAVTDKTGVVLVLIPGGTATLGAQHTDSKGRESLDYDPFAQEDEAPVLRIELAPYFLGKYEISQAQWLRLAGSNPSLAAPKPGSKGSDGSFTLANPVERVSWNSAHETLQRCQLTLPTEAQWEFACRAGTNTSWFSGAAADSLERYANLADQRTRDLNPDLLKHLAPGDYAPFADAHANTAPIHEYAANPFGLVSMCGNVAEWCLDGFGPYTDPPRADDGARHPETTFAGKRVVRGGSYAFGPKDARSAARSEAAPTIEQPFIGVRAARPVDR